MRRAVLLFGAAASILVTDPDGTEHWELATPGLVVGRGEHVETGECKLPTQAQMYEEDDAHPAFIIRVRVDKDCVQRVRSVDQVRAGTIR